MLKWLALFFLLTLLSQAVPDGLWNGKPTTKAALFKALEKGDPEAKAEWAYWSYHCHDGIRPDAKKAFQLASEAAEAGSAFGQALVGIFHNLGWGGIINRDLAYQFVERSHRKDHPLGSAYLGYLLQAELYSKEKDDIDRGLQLILKSHDQGCAYATRYLAIYKKEIPSRPNHRKTALERLLQLYQTIKFGRAAALFVEFHDNGELEPLLEIDPKILKAMLKDCRERAEAGGAIYYKAASNHLRQNKRAEERRQYAFRLANLKNSEAMKHLFLMAESYGNSDHKGQLIAMDKLVAARLAREAREFGAVHPRLSTYEGVAYLKGRGGVSRDGNKAKRAFLEAIEQGKENGLTHYADLLLDKKNFPESFNEKLALQLLEYSCDPENYYAQYRVIDFAGSYFHKRNRKVDEVIKAVATLEVGWKRGLIKDPSLLQSHKFYLEKLKPHIRDQQQKDTLKRLIAADYPFDPATRTKAMEGLKEAKILPTRATLRLGSWVPKTL